MNRTLGQRITDVRRLLEAARTLHACRARYAPRLVESTGLSPEGVELGFDFLERDASEADLQALAVAAGDAKHLHVVLSSNVFIAPLRALALARAAATRVTVRPSARDPVLTHALVELARDEAIRIVDERDLIKIDANVFHLYGRDETIRALGARVGKRACVRAYGAGLGLAVVSRAGPLGVAARALALDIVAFDQRGCVSPRIALLEGDPCRSEEFAAAVHEELCAWELRVPRGSLSSNEREQSRRWFDTLSFAGRVLTGRQHAVASTPPGVPLALPPPGRHLHVAPVATLQAAKTALGTLEPFVVAVGSDDPGAAAHVAPSARHLRLGEMQRVALDGPVDLRVLRPSDASPPGAMPRSID
jgi:hypothetical protein